MTDEIVTSMPSRPLTKAEVYKNDRFGPFCIRYDPDEAFMLALDCETSIRCLGYDPKAETWLEFGKFHNDDPNQKETTQATVIEWAEAMYGDRLDADGDLEMVNVGQPPDHDDQSDTSDSTVNEVPWEVEMGLEPDYDCPDCDYYKTGLTTGPHAFLAHLQDEHGYSKSEAHKILHE